MYSDTETCNSSLVPSSQSLFKQTNAFFETKQGVDAIINHYNLKQKASVCVFSLKVSEATLCVFVGGGGAKTPTLDPVCIRETPEKMIVWSLPPQMKNPRYGPAGVHWVSLFASINRKYDDKEMSPL